MPEQLSKAKQSNTVFGLVLQYTHWEPRRGRRWCVTCGVDGRPKCMDDVTYYRAAQTPPPPSTPFPPSNDARTGIIGDVSGAGQQAGEDPKRFGAIDIRPVSKHTSDCSRSSRKGSKPHAHVPSRGTYSGRGCEVVMGGCWLLATGWYPRDMYAHG